MIKIEKDFSDIPDSLYISEDYINDKDCPDTSKITQKRRLEIIAAKKYPTSTTIKEKEFTVTKVETYDSRYKYKDIKNRLLKAHNEKCAYCETRNRRLQVEHYRPKSKYYWLAYSWDNLLLSCQACNTFKGNRFEIEGEQVNYNEADLTKLNNISSEYNEREKPKLLNPENSEDAKLFKCFEYDKNGSITSENERCAYTINLLNLNEERTLKEWRYQILKDFREKIEECVRNMQLEKVNYYIEDFVKDSKNSKIEFIAFRKYVVDNIMDNILTEVLYAE